MKQEQIIQWAREAGFFVSTELLDVDPRFQKFANLVAQHQKEQDAQICDRFGDRGMHPHECAAAIRGQE